MGGELFAQSAHMNLDGVGKKAAVTKPYMLDQLLRADRLAAVQKQVFKNRIFLGGEVYDFVLIRI